MRWGVREDISSLFLILITWLDCASNNFGKLNLLIRVFKSICDDFYKNKK